MKELVIFDLDGTLINSIKDLAISTNYALEQLNYPTHPTENYNLMVGNGINKLFERALPDKEKNKKNILEMRELFLKYYNKYNTVYTHPYEGVPALLEKLQKKGIILAVASNKYQQATEKLVKYYFPTIQFSQIFGQRENIPSKPNPTVLLEIIKATKTSINSTLMVGDSDVDMETANRAKIDACGVSWGFRTTKELKAKKPKYIVDSPTEIFTLLD